MGYKNPARKIVACIVGLAMLVGGVLGLQTPLKGGCPIQAGCPYGSGCQLKDAGWVWDPACGSITDMTCAYAEYECTNGTETCTYGCIQTPGA